jgi:hypothetical protein
MLSACVNHTFLRCDGVTRTESMSQPSSHTTDLPSRVEYWSPSKSGYLLIVRWGVWESYKALVAVEMPVDTKDQHEPR